MASRHARRGAAAGLPLRCRGHNYMYRYRTHFRVGARLNLLFRAGSALLLQRVDM